MDKQWKTSCFTSMINCESGELLLHNSYLGAVARVPRDQAERVADVLRGSAIGDSDDAAMRELCEQGFLVPGEVEERKAVINLLDKERSSILSLMILPHENCNFRCVYCYEQFKKGKMREEVVKGLKAYVNQEIGKYMGLNVSWFGGEPLLARDVVYDLSQSFMESCERHTVSYSSGMSTNGYLLTPDTLDLLLKFRAKNFQICIDGPEAIHNSKRRLAGGGGTYKRIMDNLIDMRCRAGDFFVTLRVNFDNESVPFIEDWLVDEIAPRFGGDPRFGLHFEPVTRRGGPNDGALNVCEPQQAFSVASKFFAKGISLGFSDRTVKRCLSPHGMVCYASKEQGFIVGTDGVVYKCSLVFDDPDNGVGTLTADGHLRVDRDKAAKWTTLEGRDTRACDSCALYPTCQARKCPLVTIKHNKPPCPFNREMYESLVNLVAFGGDAEHHQQRHSVEG